MIIRSDKLFQEFFDFSSELIQALEEKSIIKPAPILSAAITLNQERKNFVVRAGKGSGKTIAYLVCLFDTIFRDYERMPYINVPTLIIILPYVELVNHVWSEFMFFHKRLRPRYGSLPAKVCLLDSLISSPDLEDDLRDVPDVVISTPGPLLHCLKKGFLQAAYVDDELSCLVIDEVDQLLLDSFEDLRSIMSYIPKTCGRIVLSADPRCDLQMLRNFFASNPYIITSLKEGDVKVEISPCNVEQFYVFCEEHQKLRYLLAAIASKSPKVHEKVLIFSNSDETSFRLRHFLKKAWKPCFFSNIEILHAGVSNASIKQWVLEEFNDGCIDCLIVTDSKKRRVWNVDYSLLGGWDFLKVDLVIHFDMPTVSSHYFRRLDSCGRPNDIPKSCCLISTRDRVYEGINPMTISPYFLSDNYMECYDSAVRDYKRAHPTLSSQHE